MKNVKLPTILRKSLFGLSVLLITSFPNSLTYAAVANDSPPTSTNTQTTPVTIKSNTAPSADYTFDASSGFWINGTYEWDPTTGLTSKLLPGQYYFDNTKSIWAPTNYVYSPTTNSYQPPTPPVETIPITANPNSTSNSTTKSNSDNPTSDNPTSSVDANLNSNTNNQINNANISTSKSGDTLVSGNTNAGNAISGNASSSANIFNILQSTTGLTGNNYSTFTANITGNVDGNLLIDPNAPPILNSNVNQATNIVINNTNNNTINNNITLSAVSGNSTVQNNTNAGNAVTGSADAAANIVNIVNSVVASNKSFIGQVNIFGNLTGNILLPSSLTGNLANSTSVSNNNSTISKVINNSNNNVSNNINSIAQSGDANINNNTVAGNATSGSSNTNVTMMNLTGRTIVARNSLLVFVNVSGNWVGVIMDAPLGTNSSLLASGISKDTSSSAATIDSNTTNTINNNVSVTAKSGNANVSGNTNAGNAISGNAKTNINLVNLTNSDFNLSGWFGVLVINVFGNWNGSVKTLLASAAVDASNGVQPSINNSSIITSNNPTPMITGYLKGMSNNENNKYILKTNIVPNPGSSVNPIPNSNILSNLNNSNTKHLNKKIILNNSKSRNYIEIIGAAFAVIPLLAYELFTKLHNII